MNLNNMSVTELEALAYREVKLRDNCDRNLIVLENMIAKKKEEATKNSKILENKQKE